MVWLLPHLYFCSRHNFFRLLFYHLFIFLYAAAIRLAALRNAKAKEWLQGRKGLLAQLSRELPQNTAPIVWVHCASTGEFEQAKPVIEAICERHPQHKILATFFSPSGYNAATNYQPIHYRHYLPMDTEKNAARFVQVVKPSLVIFSKYDFWYHHLKAVNKAGVPLLLISALFRPGQAFFKWYGGFYKKMLLRFHHLFVQDDASLQLLKQHGIRQCSVSGDTRFDRVLALKQQKTNTQLELIKQVVAQKDCVVAGSTWAGDEAMLASVHKRFSNLFWIIVPHEINTAHIKQLKQAFPQSVLFSEIEKAVQAMGNEKEKVDENGDIPNQKIFFEQIASADALIVDTVGLLSRLYQLATITYIGGGFTKDGVHNTLEAAVWGRPVVVGPNYQKYREAKELIRCGGAFAVPDATVLEHKLKELLNNKAALKTASEAAQKYVAQNSGATNHIMKYIQEKRLLTNWAK